MPLGANAGYKLFNTGDVLTAAQVQNNLQNQSIMFFASAAVRDADTALTAALTEGMFCYLANTNEVQYYDGAAWQSFATGDITGLTAGTGITITNASGPVPTIALSTNGTLTSPKETVQVVATPGATGTVNIDTLTSSVEYLQAAATANWTTNVRGSGAATLNSTMAIGEQISVVLLNTNTGTAYYPTAFNIDGTAVGVTLKWLGGTAPASGNINSVDAYVYTIIKTAASTYTVLASQNKFA
jgi:hypothetical protein